jgi:ATP-dependent Clp protease protease subunit
MIRTQEQLYKVLAHHCGKELDQISKDCDRNNWMDAEQSVAYGLADKVLKSMDDKPALRSV